MLRGLLNYNLTTWIPSKTTFKANEEVEIRVDVKNSSKIDGSEVVQLYIRDVVGSVTRPLRELKGFQKIALRAGETKTVSFKITTADLKFYNSDLNFVAEPGTFEIYVGGNSDASLKVQIELLP